MNSLPLKIYHRLDLYYINVSFFSWLSVFFRPSSVLGDVHIYSLCLFAHSLTHSFTPFLAPSQCLFYSLSTSISTSISIRFIWTILNWIEHDACTLYKPCVFGFLCLSHWYNSPCSYGLDMGFPILSFLSLLSLRAHQKTLNWMHQVPYNKEQSFKIPCRRK